ncbi:MAG: YaaR family protein [Candidatus Rifleibacteriota bacterium]
MPVKITNQNIDPGKTPENKHVKGNSSDRGQFKAELKTSSVKILDQNLEQLIDTVKTRGESFLKSPDENLLKSYKDSIKQFLKKVTREFLSLKEEFGAPSEGEKKVFQLVNSTDSEVESLTRDTLNENQAVNLLSSLDDIRGLVLDIMG